MAQGQRHTDMEDYMTPVLTIITSTLNCKAMLDRTASSIRNQEKALVNWIVIDGGSTDGTLDVIKANEDIIAKWISGPDTGIYDAWNKGCAYISGAWVLFLGAGDTLENASTTRRLMDIAQTTPNDTVLLHGNVTMVSAHNFQPRYVRKTPNLDGWSFGRPQLPHHQGVLHRADLFAGPASFDTSYRIAGDSKFMLAAMQKGAVKYIDIDVAHMTDDGISNTGGNGFRVQKEIDRLCYELGISQPTLQKIKAYGHRGLIALYMTLPKALQNKLRAANDRKRSLRK